MKKKDMDTEDINPGFEEENEKLNAGYINKKYKMLFYQSLNFYLMIAVVISGLIIYYVNKYNAPAGISEIISAVRRDVKNPDALQAAVYDKDVAGETEPESHEETDWEKYAQNETFLRIFKKYNIKYINQIEDNMPNGCEVVSLAMVLSRYLPDISAHEISEKYLPRKNLPVYRDGIYFADDPTYYFIGNPADKGYGIFAPGLAKAAQDTVDAYKLDKTVYDISGCSEDELFKNITDGYPVIVWITMNLAPVKWGTIASWHLPNGKLYRWPSPMHCAVLVDFTDTNVTLYDPTYGIDEYDRNLFIQRWDELGAYSDKTRNAVVIK